ncbi:FACT complex subunit SPT16 [Forsythia ovata]|uniref:FACT complex subunit n=1 Tax=Forsythia ovata TaxID=205694 RepID=A0ABD1TMI8_9LAMI
MHVKAKTEDGSTQMDAVLHAIHSQSKQGESAAPTVGYIAREVPEGKLLELWADKLKNSGFQLIDMTNGLTDLFAVKDKTFVMKNFVVPKVEKVIDEEKKVTHSSLTDDTEKAILSPVKIGVKLKADNVEICYPPIFQSGGKFDLRLGASSNDEYLYYDSSSVIICALGSRYSSYCSNVARTYFIDADGAHSKAYEVLLKAHEAAILALKPGNLFSAVYQAALSVVKRDAPELVPNLTKYAGTGIGLEFREPGMSLNARNERVLKSGMVFNVSLGFQNLQTNTSSPKSQNFSLALADTVIVTDDGCNVATSLSSKFLKDEELRKQHQAELAHQKNAETARRLAGVGSGIWR